MKNCEYQQIDPQALSTPTPTPPQACPERKTKTPQRKWEVFPGKNRFYCDGRIVVARHSGVFPLTLGLIVVTSVLFFIFDCPFLVKHLASCIPAVGGVLFVLVIISLLQTSFSDPGILPRATPDEAADIEKQIDNPGPSAAASSSYRPPPRTKEVLINQRPVKLKYCFTCKLFRPPRTSHCSLCDNCVERFDHHCPWVGNCVGKRNYRFFYTFIVSLSFHTAFIFGCVTTHLALRSQGGNGLVFALQESPASALELVVCFFSVWSILGLSGFHTYLVAANLTTNEDIKGSWSGKSGTEVTGNPYSYNNIFTNCCSLLCGPMPPSLIDRRGFVPTDDSAQVPPAQVALPAAKNDINMCTQGTKDLLETAAPPPLLSAPCPQLQSGGSPFPSEVRGVPPSSPPPLEPRLEDRGGSDRTRGERSSKGRRTPAPAPSPGRSSHRSHSRKQTTTGHKHHRREPKPSSQH